MSDELTALLRSTMPFCATLGVRAMSMSADEVGAACAAPIQTQAVLRAGVP